MVLAAACTCVYKQRHPRQPATCLPTAATYTHEQDLLVMGTGGTFLRVLATGTLAVVMAAVPPPPDHHGPSPRVTDPEDPQCDVPDVTVVDGQPAHIATGAKWQPMTVYFHASERFDALRIKVYEYSDYRGVMWVPYPAYCIHETDGWYEAVVHCEELDDTDHVVCSFKVQVCRILCLMNVRMISNVVFSVTAYGHSLWRRNKPPKCCRVHEVIDNVHFDTKKCHDNPFATSTSTKGASPPTTGATTSITNAMPPTTGATPLTSAAPNRNSSGVEAQVAAVVQVG